VDVFKNSEEIPTFLEDGLLKELPLKEEIYIDDTIGFSRINIPVSYKFTHPYWEFIIGYTTYYELNRNGFINFEGDDSLFYLSIEYDLSDQNNKSIYECILPENFVIYKDYSKYFQFCTYVISNMTPSDFQAYDWAMTVLLDSTGNNLFNRTFGMFFEDLSKDDYLDPDERYVLEKLISWTETRGDLEKPDHFLYFLNSFDEDNYIDINAVDD
jgi:hypothetical protein